MTDIAHEVIKVYVGKPNPNYHDLPSQYTELDYIENNGYEYIDTGLPVSSTTKIEAIFQITETKYGFETYVFGNYPTDSNESGIRIGVNIENLFNSTGTATFSQTSDIFAKTEVSVIAKTGTTSEDNILIFACQRDSIEGIGKLKLYSLKIYDTTNDELIKNFIPCYKNSDLTNGLYDIINDVFYTSVEIIPSEYQRVEYIQSTGTQYIDTEYVPTSDTGLYVTFDINNSVSSESSGAVLGIDEGDGTRYVLETWTADLETNQGNFWIGNTWASVNPMIVSDTKLTIAHSPIKDTVARNDNSYVSCTNVPEIVNPIYIFGRNINEGSYSLSRTKIYNLSFYENYDKVHSYIPVIRKSDDKPGLYDIISNSCYFNNGEDEFLYGNVIKDFNSGNEIFPEVAHISTTCYVGAKRTLELPDEYVEVEYIQNDGIGYIDSGIAFSTSIKIEADFQFVEYQTGFESWVAGTWNTDAGIHFGLAHDGTPTVSGGTISQVTNSFARTTVVATQKSGYTSITNNNIYIFTENNSGKKLSSSGIIKIYSLKIYDNTTLLKNFIPCYRKSDDVVGLYDIISGIFYTPTYDIPQNYQRIEYIRSTGTQYIDTGYVGNSTTGFFTKFNTENSLTTNNTLAGAIFGGRDSRTNLYYLQTYTDDPENLAGCLVIGTNNADAGIVPLSLMKISHSAADNLLTRTDGTSVSIANGNRATMSNAIFAFYRWNSGVLEPFLLSKTKMYQFIFYENYKSVHEYIPVIDLENNNKPGLYDIIDQEFLTNKDEEGDDFLISENNAPEFITGSIIPSVAHEVVKIYVGV